MRASLPSRAASQNKLAELNPGHQPVTGHGEQEEQKELLVNFKITRELWSPTLLWSTQPGLLSEFKY